jgi:O-acetyl-ADP-ribose deacetylase (regulator of RNase III)
MKRTIRCADIVTVRSDAMIYSTNVRLALTGGVGAALVKQYGIGVQIDLQDQSLGTGRQMADVGEVIETRITDAPWKRVFHTIATDELYHTAPSSVRDILRTCFKKCAASASIKTITCSALGTGYGNLELPAFMAIADEVSRDFMGSGFSSFTVVVRDSAEYQVLCDFIGHTDGWSQTEANQTPEPTAPSGRGSS